MEFRKLISFGKSSFVVSLPKAWVVQQKLKKGDLIAVDEAGPKLILSKQVDATKEEVEKEITILVDGKTKEHISRETCSAYIRNYRTIKFKGEEAKTKVREIQEITQNMMALEILEQTENCIIAKDFLNMDKVSSEELIRKMDVVTRTMIDEARKVFTDNNYINLNERDKDVNRLYFLLYRSAIYNIENPTRALKNFKLTSIDFMRLHFVAFYIEQIADEARRFARYAHELKLSSKLKLDIEEFVKDVREHYIATMKSTYTQNVKETLRLSEFKVNFDQRLDKFELEVKKNEGLHLAIDRLRRMIIGIHNLGRVIYTL